MLNGNQSACLRIRQRSARVARSLFLHLLAALDGDSRPQPLSEFALSQAAFGEADVQRIQFDVVCCERTAVEDDEHFACHCGGALVAIDKRMVTSKSERKAGGKVCEVWCRVAVRMGLLRTRQCRVKQGFITHAVAATMFGKLALVDGERQRPYLAAVRNQPAIRRPDASPAYS